MNAWLQVSAESARRTDLGDLNAWTRLPMPALAELSTLGSRVTEHLFCQATWLIGSTNP